MVVFILLEQCGRFNTAGQKTSANFQWNVTICCCCCCCWWRSRTKKMGRGAVLRWNTGHQCGLNTDDHADSGRCGHIQSKHHVNKCVYGPDVFLFFFFFCCFTRRQKTIIWIDGQWKMCICFFLSSLFRSLLLCVCLFVVEYLQTVLISIWIDRRPLHAF